MDKLQEIKDYRESPALNYSFLKAVLENYKPKIKESIPMVLGSALDCLLTCPELFDDLFIVKDIERPKSKVVNFIEKKI